MADTPQVPPVDVPAQLALFSDVVSRIRQQCLEMEQTDRQIVVNAALLNLHGAIVGLRRDLEAAAECEAKEAARPVAPSWDSSCRGGK